MQGARGLVMINTGQGKGKTTAALGAALRAAGQGLSVLILQFIKGTNHCGEHSAIERLPQIEIRPLGLGLIKDAADLTPHRDKALQGWQQARQEVLKGAWGLVVLDEICVALQRGLLPLDEVLQLVKDKPPPLHLILTGRNCPPELMELADTVTVMQEAKHHSDQGVEAQAGVEY